MLIWPLIPAAAGIVRAYAFNHRWLLFESVEWKRDIAHSLGTIGPCPYYLREPSGDVKGIKVNSEFWPVGRGVLIDVCISYDDLLTVSAYGPLHRLACILRFAHVASLFSKDLMC